ncbi:MAG: hypothetical protein HOV86_24700 [Thermoactinospora sp.]|nr:hypothetical protein [Thermoactinospora sp.]
MRSGRIAVSFAVLAMLLASPVSQPALADPDPAKVKRLTKQAAQLEKLYRGQIQSLEEIKVQIKDANTQTARLEKLLANARGDVTAMAQTSYITGPMDPSRLLGAGDPYKVLGRAASLSYLTEERADQVKRLKELIKEAKASRAAASEKVDKLEAEIKKMQGKRRDVQQLLTKFGFQPPTSGGGLTARMVAVRNAVTSNFPVKSVGCFRAGDPGEHGKGRACDFMMTLGGQMASGDSAHWGDQIAQYLIDNGQQLGVMYIIWKQRYYDIRSGGGWDPMSDRGGVTANHWDHVHVSVF